MEQRQRSGYQHVPLAIFLMQMTVWNRAAWQAALRQFFHWQPFDSKTGEQPIDSASADSTLRLLPNKGYKVDQPMEGCTWECDLVDDEHLRSSIIINNQYFSEVEVAFIASSMTNILEFLCDISNWGKEVREITSAFHFDLFSRDQDRDVTS